MPKIAKDIVVKYDMTLRSLLSGYPARKKVYSFLQDEYKKLRTMTDVSAQQYTERVTNGHQTVNPVEKYFFKLEELASVIWELADMIEPIEELENVLSHNQAMEAAAGITDSDSGLMLYILHKHYFEGHSLATIHKESYIPKNRLYNIKRQLDSKAMILFRESYCLE